MSKKGISGERMSMDFLPGFTGLRENSEKAAAKASQKLAEHEEPPKDKAGQEQLMQEMAQEYYQQMKSITSPVRCLTSKPQGIWKRMFADRNYISGHILKKPGATPTSPIYYLIDLEGRRWVVVKDSSAKHITWLIERSVPYDGQQFARGKLPSDSWKRQLTQNLESAVNQFTLSNGPVSAKEAKRQGRDAGIARIAEVAGMVLRRAKERLVVRSREEETSESYIDLEERLRHCSDIDE